MDKKLDENLDIIAIASLQQYFGTELLHILPPIDELLRIAEVSPMSQHMINIFQKLMRRSTCNQLNWKLCDISDKIVQLTEDERSALIDDFDIISVELKLKLLHALIEKRLFVPSQVNGTSKQLDSDSGSDAETDCKRPPSARLGVDRFGYTYWLCLDPLATVRVYAVRTEHFANGTGDWRAIVRNGAELRDAIVQLQTGRRIAPLADDESPMLDHNGNKSGAPSAKNRQLRCASCEFRSKNGCSITVPYLCDECLEACLVERMLEVDECIRSMRSLSMDERCAAVASIPTIDSDVRLLFECKKLGRRKLSDRTILRYSPPDGWFHPGAIYMDDPNVWQMHIQEVRQTVRSMFQNVSRKAKLTSQELFKWYEEVCRPLMEADVHIWSGGCTPEDLRDFDQLQNDVVELSIDLRKTRRISHTVQLDSLAERRQRILTSEFYKLYSREYGQEVYSAIPKKVYAYVRNVNSENPFNTISTERSFVARGRELFKQQPRRAR